MVLDNLGLAVAVLLTHAVRASEPARSALPLVMFPLLVIGDLTSIYQCVCYRALLGGRGSGRGKWSRW